MVEAQTPTNDVWVRKGLMLLRGWCYWGLERGLILLRGWCYWGLDHDKHMVLNWVKLPSALPSLDFKKTQVVSLRQLVPFACIRFADLLNPFISFESNIMRHCVLFDVRWGGVLLPIIITSRFLVSFSLPLPHLTWKRLFYYYGFSQIKLSHKKRTHMTSHNLSPGGDTRLYRVRLRCRRAESGSPQGDGRDHKKFWWNLGQRPSPTPSTNSVFEAVFSNFPCLQFLLSKLYMSEVSRISLSLSLSQACLFVKETDNS